MKIKHSIIFCLPSSPKNIRFHGKIGKIEADLQFQGKQNIRRKCTRWRSSATQYFFFPFPQKISDSNEKSARSKQICDFKGKRICGIRWRSSAAQYFFFPFPQKISDSTRKSARSKQICDFKRKRICDVNVQDENQTQHNILFSFFPKKYPRKNRQDRNRFAISGKQNMRRKWRWSSSAAYTVFFVPPPLFSTIVIESNFRAKFAYRFPRSRLIVVF